MARITTKCSCGCEHILEYGGGGKIEKSLLTKTCFKCNNKVQFTFNEDMILESPALAAEEKPTKENTIDKSAPKKRGRKPKIK